MKKPWKPHVSRVFDDLKLRSALAEGVTEQLKAENQMLWAQHMNNIRSCAAEIVCAELIYA